MAGNFIKGGFVKLEDSKKKVIDNNEAIKKKLEEIRSTMISMEEESSDSLADEFSEGINPVAVSLLVSDNGDSVDNMLDDFSEGIGGENVSSGNIIKPVSESAYDEMINKAELEAEEIRKEAKEEGYQEGFNTGHEEGYAAGMSEAREALENEYRQKEESLVNELSLKEQELLQAYESRINDIEPLLVEKIMDVIKHVTGVELAGNKDTILGILKMALENMDSGKHYLIHVSPVDYENVKNSKSELSKGTGLLEDDFDIIEDNSVAPNGALIESESGIFDCGLGSQLELLKKKLLLISYQ